MITKETIKKSRDLISNNRTEAAIKTIKEKFDNHTIRYRNALLVAEANYNNLIQQRLKNVISEKDYQSEKNKINEGVLVIIERIEDELYNGEDTIRLDGNIVGVSDFIGIWHLRILEKNSSDKYEICLLSNSNISGQTTLYNPISGWNFEKFSIRIPDIPINIGGSWSLNTDENTLLIDIYFGVKFYNRSLKFFLNKKHGKNGFSGVDVDDYSVDTILSKI